MMRHVSPRLAAYAGSRRWAIAGLAAGRSSWSRSRHRSRSPPSSAPRRARPELEAALRSTASACSRTRRSARRSTSRPPTAPHGWTSCSSCRRADVRPGRTRSACGWRRARRGRSSCRCAATAGARSPSARCSCAPATRSASTPGRCAAARAAGLRVYPSVETLHALLPPYETQVFIGNQVSRAKGEGIEFADVRPWTPGDRPRRINWRASARRDELWVNDQHPERNTDSSSSSTRSPRPGGGGRSTLDLAVRAASRSRTATSAQGPRRARQLRRLPPLARARVRDAAALQDRRLAPPDGRRAQLRGEGRRRPAAANAAAEGARDRADAAARPRSARRCSTSAPAASTSSSSRSPPCRSSIPARASWTAVVPAVAVVARVAARALRARRRAGRRMARRRSPRRAAGGGGRIQALRQARARVTLALLVLARIRGRARGGDRARDPSSALMSAGSGRRGSCSSCSCSCAASKSCCRLWSCASRSRTPWRSIVHGASVDERVPLVGTGLLLCCELACGARPAKRVAAERPRPPRAARRARALVGGALARPRSSSRFAAASIARGLVWTIAGAAAAVLAVGLAVRAHPP